MNNLTRFDHDGLELVIDSNTGACFASQGMIASLCSQESSIIKAYFRQIGVKESLRDTSTDVAQKPVLFFNEDAIYQALSGYKLDLLIQCAKIGIKSQFGQDEDAIYQSFVRYTPENLIQYARLGIRIYLHRLVGVTTHGTLQIQNQ